MSIFEYDQERRLGKKEESEETIKEILDSRKE